MIDTLSLLISHGAILLAAWRLIPRADLDRDPDSAPDSAIVSLEAREDA